MHIATRPLQQGNQPHSATITGVDTTETPPVVEASPKSVYNVQILHVVLSIRSLHVLMCECLNCDFTQTFTHQNFLNHLTRLPVPLQKKALQSSQYHLS